MDHPHPPIEDGSLPPRSTDSLDVLLIEGHPEDARRFEECLQESAIGASLRHEPSLEAGLDVLGDPGPSQPDVVVVSAGLSGGEKGPGIEGAGAVETVVAAAPGLPVVVLVGPEDVEVALQIRKAGVAESLRKEALSPPLLGRTLQWALRETRMQQKLRQRDAWVRSITDGLSAGVFRAGPTGRIKYANKALARMLGFSGGEELIGKDLTEFCADPRQRGRMLAAEGASAAEVTFKQKEGEELTGLLSAEAAYNAEGTPVHYDGTITDITDWKEKEEKLRVLSEAVRQAKESIVITEAEPLSEPGPRIEYINEAFEEMTGYSEEEIVGETPRVLQGPETDREILDSLRDALEAEEEWKNETINYRKDGEPYRVQWNVAPVRGEDGSVEHWVSVQRDVTDQRRQEKRIERQNDLFRRAQEIADVGAWEYEVESNRLTWTEQMHKVYGLSPEETPTLDRALAAYHPDDRPKIQDALDRAICEKDPYDLELRFIPQGGPQEGEERWVRTRGEPVHENGAVTSVRGTIQDMTDQREAEAEVRSMKNYYEQILNQIPIDLAVFTPEATFEYTNPQNVNDPEVRDWLQGRTNEDYFRENDRDVEIGRARDRCIRRVAQENETRQIEETIRGENGPRHFLRVHGPVTDLNGKVTNVVAFGLDITERKRREEQLRDAKEEAESANRMKSAFLATMSHEIRTPLTSILGFAEAIEEETKGLQAPIETGDLAPLNQFAGLIQRSGMRLMKTLTGVLNLSRLEAGEMDLASRPVNLADQADEVAEEFRPRAEERGLAVQVKAEGPAWAYADEGGVQIVLRNLLSNAIKYTETGGVEVLTYEEDGEGTSEANGPGTAVIEVEDTGIGMNASQAEDLFEPFRQESEGLSREYEGTGLGLAVTREATEEMGGTIEVDTQKGEGSRFTVRLPRAEAH